MADEQDQEALQHELQKLRAENEQLRARRTTGDITLRVSEKGAVSVYGLGRFPVTLYQEQWEKLLRHADDIREFVDAHREQLKKKA